MAKPKLDLNRRHFLLKSLYGSVGSAFALEYLTGAPMIGNFLAEKYLDPLAHSLDAFPLIGDAISGGSSLLKVHQAMAQGANDWNVITIKVVNHVATPLVFGLGKINADNTLDMGDSVTNMPSIAGQAKDYLTASGALSVSEMPRYKNLRLNKWFADILHFGTSDGKASTGTNTMGLPVGATGLFPANVALQAGLHLQQSVDVNHSIKGFKVRADKPDLAKYIDDLGILKSPLGITCFMAGGEYDKAEGSTPVNIVCDSVGENPALASRTVNDYVKNISQSLSAGYGDTRKVEENIVAKFDKLAKGSSGLRKELIESRDVFIQTLANLQVASDIEQAQRQTFSAATGNGQSGGMGQDKGAQTEFLGQCFYAAQAISGLEGSPLRNFSLFLNMNDLDKKSLDTVVTNGSNAKSIKALTYIEGMRQLAVGLNILSKPIAAGKKVIVQVLAEGGRSQDMGDSKISFAFVMGPGGAGMLADNLMANSVAISTPGGAVVRDPGTPANGSVAWDGDELREEDGTAAAAGTLPTTGDLQMGVVEFLADVTGQTAKLETGRGRYVKLKRGL